jgi:hypothetical protein
LWAVSPSRLLFFLLFLSIPAQTRPDSRSPFAVLFAATFLSNFLRFVQTTFQLVSGFYSGSALPPPLFLLPRSGGRNLPPRPIPHLSISVQVVVLHLAVASSIPRISFQRFSCSRLTTYSCCYSCFCCYSASAFSCSANRSLLGLLVKCFFDNFAVSFHDDSILTRFSGVFYQFPCYFSNQVLCFEPFFSFFKYYYYVFSCFANNGPSGCCCSILMLVLRLQ